MSCGCGCNKCGSTPNGGIGQLGMLVRTTAKPISKYLNGLGSLGDFNVDWGDIISSASDTGLAIAKAQFGQPNINPGTFIQTKDGVMYRVPTGSNVAFNPVGFSSSGSGTSLLLVGGLIIGAILLFKR